MVKLRSVANKWVSYKLMEKLQLAMKFSTFYFPNTLVKIIDPIIIKLLQRYCNNFAEQIKRAIDETLTALFLKFIRLID